MGYMRKNKLARPQGDPSSRVTLSGRKGHPPIAEPFFFFHINSLARLAGSTWSRQDNKSMRKRCLPSILIIETEMGSAWLGQKGQFFSHINADSTGRVAVLPGKTFLHINRA